MRAHAVFRETSWGAVCADPRWPDVWDANKASVLRPRPDLGLAEVRAELDPVLEGSGASFAAVEFLDAGTACPAMAEAAALVPDTDDDVVMAYRGQALDQWRRSAAPLPVEVTEPDDRFRSFSRSIPTFYGPMP